MAIVYFDASALVKLMFQEPGSDLAVRLWDGCDAAVSSRLAYPEVHAAMAAAERNHDISPADLKDAERLFGSYWPSVRPVGLTSRVERQAGELAVRLALRGADAVHLASAVVLDEPGLVFAAWDRRLRRGAQAAGLALAPAGLP